MKNGVLVLTILMSFVLAENGFAASKKVTFDKQQDVFKENVATKSKDATGLNEQIEKYSDELIMRPIGMVKGAVNGVATPFQMKMGYDRTESRLHTAANGPKLRVSF